MSVTAANILLALEIIAQLADKANRLALVVHKAQSEGRDITQAELDEAKAGAKNALDSLGAALEEDRS